MREKTKRFSDEEKKAAQHAYRITWIEKNPLGRWNTHQRVEYAESKDRAVNAALAKIRRDYPAGCVTACEPIISRSPGLTPPAAPQV